MFDCEEVGLVSGECCARALSRFPHSILIREQLPCLTNREQQEARLRVREGSGVPTIGRPLYGSRLNGEKFGEDALHLRGAREGYARAGSLACVRTVKNSQ